MVLGCRPYSRAGGYSALDEAVGLVGEYLDAGARSTCLVGACSNCTGLRRAEAPLFVPRTSPDMKHARSKFVTTPCGLHSVARKVDNPTVGVISLLSADEEWHCSGAGV